MFGWNSQHLFRNIFFQPVVFYYYKALRLYVCLLLNYQHCKWVCYMQQTAPLCSKPLEKIKIKKISLKLDIYIAIWHPRAIDYLSLMINTTIWQSHTSVTFGKVNETLATNVSKICLPMVSPEEYPTKLPCAKYTIALTHMPHWNICLHYTVWCG